MTALKNTLSSHPLRMNETDSVGAPGQKRRSPALCGNPGSDLQLAAMYQVPAPTQGWFLEGVRLAEEYLRTGRQSHLAALERHVAGILQRMREGRA